MNWNSLLPRRPRLRGRRQLRRRSSPTPTLRVLGRGTRSSSPSPSSSSAWCSGLLIALLLDRKFLGRGVVRTMMIAPFLVVPDRRGPALEARAVQPELRPVQRHCSTRSGGSSAATARRSPTGSATARRSPSRSSLIWQWTPFMMLILLAGLQAKPARRRRGGPHGRRQRLADLPLPDLPAPAPVPRAGGAARLDLHRAELRRRLHHHLRRPRHGEPAVHDLPDVFSAHDYGLASAMGVVVVIGTIIVATFALRVVSSLFKRGGRR